jgi:hypothetical protein
MRGRKPKLTPEVSQRIIELVRIGNYLDAAAASCGIHRSTLHRWLVKGEEQSHGMYREFFLAIDRAQGEGELRDCVLIAKAAQTDWRAAAWRLERRAPRKYGARIQATLREEVESMLAHLETVLDRATFEKVIAALEQARTPGAPSLPANPTGRATVSRDGLLERLNRIACLGANEQAEPQKADAKDRSGKDDDAAGGTQ